jgi:hypothetical protein
MQNWKHRPPGIFTLYFVSKTSSDVSRLYRDQVAALKAAYLLRMTGMRTH